MDIQKIDDKTKQQVFDHFKVLNDPTQAGPFCVDGRWGNVSGGQREDDLYAQALGGSLLFGVLTYLLEERTDDFNSAWSEVIKQLQKSNHSVGVHRGSHKSEDASDCGFADNLPKIVKRLAEKSDDIKTIIESATTVFSEDELDFWQEITNLAQHQELKGFNTGEQLVSTAESKSAAVQTLAGDHAEVAAVVNIQPGTTLDTKSLVDNDLQAFNLDLWYVLNVNKTVLGLNEHKVKLLSLGLYVATEMVLVEDKKNYRLPVIINS